MCRPRPCRAGRRSPRSRCRRVAARADPRRAVVTPADRVVGPGRPTCCSTDPAVPDGPTRVFRCDQCGFVLDRDLNAARNLAASVSTASCVGTVNMPAGNRVRPRSRGGGIATGRPETTVAGQPRRGNPAGQETESRVS
ncbi:zinc ribbon domain-containing protein [Nocardia sp. CA-151230]|uniref:zinc ribbon domain-containing protein n=1 Tax=Nocardia sp. CA-151230 TaxID=3239982 RepID=UPI003D8DFC0D